MSQDNFTFSRTLNAAQLASLTAQALKVGVKLGTSGTLPKHDGVVLAYTIGPVDTAGNVLATMTIKERPWPMTDEGVEKIIVEKLQLPPA